MVSENKASIDGAQNEIKPTERQRKTVFRLAARLVQEKGITQKVLAARVEDNGREVDQGFTFSESALSRHLDAPSGRISGLTYQALIRVLKNEGYWPPNTVLDPFAFALTTFVAGDEHDESIKFLHDLKGRYRYFQWSSWHPGNVTVSEFHLSSQRYGLPYLHAREKQRTGEDFAVEQGVSNTTEAFNGLAIVKEKLLYLIMREELSSRPKFCIIETFVPNEEGQLPYQTLSGYTLKGSGSRSQTHRSAIVMQRVDDGEVESQTCSQRRCRDLFPAEFSQLVTLSKDSNPADPKD